MIFCRMAQICAVSTHSRLKAAGDGVGGMPRPARVSTHSRLKAAGKVKLAFIEAFKVSTHSRLKAAGTVEVGRGLQGNCFNTQPPEGGWIRQGLVTLRDWVSTHSRLKAAGWVCRILFRTCVVSTHSRLKAAGSAQCST